MFIDGTRTSEIKYEESSYYRIGRVIQLCDFKQKVVFKYKYLKFHYKFILIELVWYISKYT
jgi:hypothetical protein